MRNIKEMIKKIDKKDPIQFNYMFNERTARWDACSKTSDDFEYKFIINDQYGTSSHTYLVWNNEDKVPAIYLVGTPL